MVSYLFFLIVGSHTIRKWITDGCETKRNLFAVSRIRGMNFCDYAKSLIESTFIILFRGDFHQICENAKSVIWNMC